MNFKDNRKKLKAQSLRLKALLKKPSRGPFLFNKKARPLK
jgi:hypothetical protein